MKLYHDTESGELITLEQLKKEYEELKATGDTEAETFEIYFRNCTTREGGTLEEV